MPSHSIFVASAPGLEESVREEALALGLGRVTVVPGGIELNGGLATVYKLNLHLGGALKVLVRLGRFHTQKLKQLRRRAGELPWSEWVPSGAPIRVRAKCVRSRLYHSGAVAQRVFEAAAEGTGCTMAGGDEWLTEVLVRMHKDRCTIALSSSGTPLNKRGYRYETGKAPLREDLAYSLIRLSGWDGKRPLVDPFCGSGTIAIEADAWARGVAPGLRREFAFEHFPNFDSALWEQLRGEAEARVRAEGPPVMGSDRDAGVVEAALRNAERASARVDLHHADLSSTGILGEGAQMLVSNPPYGRRVGGPDLRPLYQRLGQRLGNDPCALVVPDMAMAGWLGRRFRSALLTDHGGSKVHFALSEGR